MARLDQRASSGHKGNGIVLNADRLGISVIHPSIIHVFRHPFVRRLPHDDVSDPASGSLLDILVPLQGALAAAAAFLGNHHDKL